MLFVRRDIFPQFLNSSMNEWETCGFVSTAKFVLPAWFQNNLPSDYQKFISLNSRSVYRQFSPKHYLSNVYISYRCFFIFWRKLQGSCLHSENIKFRPENAQWLFSIKWQKLWGLIELAQIYLTVVIMYTNEANFPREYVTENINPERTENHQSPFTTITYL